MELLEIGTEVVQHREAEHCAIGACDKEGLGRGSRCHDTGGRRLGTALYGCLRCWLQRILKIEIVRVELFSDSPDVDFFDATYYVSPQARPDASHEASSRDPSPPSFLKQLATTLDERGRS